MDSYVTPEECTDGRTWQLCACEKTCESQGHICNGLECKPGCACEDGMVWDEDKCIRAEECSCSHNGISFASGESIDVEECTRCHCLNGTKVCAERCSLTEEMCKLEGKTLINEDIEDFKCCHCASTEPTCYFAAENKHYPVSGKDLWRSFGTIRHHP